jgi:hypothetical protein
VGGVELHFCRVDYDENNRRKPGTDLGKLSTELRGLKGSTTEKIRPSESSWMGGERKHTYMPPWYYPGVITYSIVNRHYFQSRGKKPPSIHSHGMPLEWSANEMKGMCAACASRHNGMGIMGWNP